MTKAEETLRWERAYRTRAGVAAIAAGVLTLGGNLLVSASLSGLPKTQGDRVVTITDALRDTVAGRPIPAGRLAEQTRYLGEHATGPVIGAILAALGALLFFLPLAYLFRAARARNPSLAQWVLVLLAIGVVLHGVGNLVSSLARDLGARSFVHAANQTNAAAADALTQSPAGAGQIFTLAGGLALGFATVIIALNAMRVGLLTRFIGILGMIVGATFVLPLDQLGIIRSFWLGALGALILGRLPNGMPRAWELGEAVPWPTQQEVREERERLRAERSGEPAAAAGASATAAPARTSAPAEHRRAPAPARPAPRTGEAHPSSKKKRRRRQG